MCEVLEVDTKIEDLKLLKPPRFVDSRGYFEETFNYKKVNEVGLRLEFVQDNHSLSKEMGKACPHLVIQVRCKPSWRQRQRSSPALSGQ